MNLNFSITELCKSETAIKHNIANIPDLKSLDNMLNLIVFLLQPIRDKFGAIQITSGFRNARLNQLVGGVPYSNHLFGYAADIIPKQTTFKKVYDYIIQNLDFDECYIETSKGKKWLHIAYRKDNNRKKCNSDLMA